MMTLLSIATNNIKKNFKTYWAFFLSSAFSVFALYLFLSITNNKDVQRQLGGMKSFMWLFIIGTWLIGFFSAFFIWYSNSFFIKSRKKEFATYMLLGMTKNQTAGLNFIENLFIMLLSFFSGIGVGIILNKLFIMILYTMIRVSGDVRFQFSMKAFKSTSIIFAVMFIIISLHSTILIHKNSLINLFNASKKAEKGIKVSLFTIIIGIISIALIAYSYYLAVKKLPSNITLSPEVVIFTVVGSILLITCTVSFFIYISKRNEKRLFSGTKLISTSQLYYRYRGNVGTLGVIAVTTTIALSSLITCLGSYDKAEENSRYMRPYSIEYFNNTDSIDKTFNDTLSNHKETAVKYKDSFDLLNITAKDPFGNGNSDFYVINESEFNKINKHENVNRKVSLKTDEDCYFVQVSPNGFTAEKSAIGKEIILTNGNKQFNVKIIDTDNKSFIALDHFKPTLVIKDNVYNDFKLQFNKDKITNVTGYLLTNDIIAKNFLADIKNKIPTDNNLLTFYDHFMDGLKLLGMMAFIGLFIGLLFITATGSIIYFKMAMEAREDRNKFITLSKIGVSRKEIKGAVSKQLLVLFGVPFVIAAANSYAATISLGKMLAFKLGKEFLAIILVYAVLFSIYYFLTLNTYTKTVCE